MGKNLCGQFCALFNCRILTVNEKGSVHEGMENMCRAFELYSQSTMTLNHLANRFFFTWQHFLVEQLTETTLLSTNHPLMKYHSYYNIAQSYHSKGDYDTIGRYYMALVKEIQRP